MKSVGQELYPRSEMTVIAKIEPKRSATSKPEKGYDHSGLACLVIVARYSGLHLSVPQLIHDNVLTGRQTSTAQLLKCARSAGLKAKATHLTWDKLSQLKKALPAIVTLKSGASMVLLRLTGGPNDTRVVLQDPNTADDATLVIDQVRFEDAWSGEVIFVKRNYEISDE